MNTCDKCHQNLPYQAELNPKPKHILAEPDATRLSFLKSTCAVYPNDAERFVAVMFKNGMSPELRAAVAQFLKELQANNYKYKNQ